MGEESDKKGFLDLKMCLHRSTQEALVRGIGYYVDLLSFACEMSPAGSCV